MSIEDRIKEIKKYFPVMKRVGSRLFLYRGKSYIEVRISLEDIFIDYYRIDPKILSIHFRALSTLYAKVEKAREERKIAEKIQKEFLEEISSFRKEESRDFISKVCGREIVGGRNKVNDVPFIYKDNACYVRGVKMSIFDIVNKSVGIKSALRYYEFKNTTVIASYANFICSVSCFFNRV